MQAIRVPWTSESFLLYAGGLVVLIAVSWLLSVLSDTYGDAAFVGWSVLVLAFLLACATSFRRAARPVAAGLFAVSSVIAFGVLVGALEDWFGWLAQPDAPFQGFHVSLFLIELLVLWSALAALRVFHFPLLVFVAATAAWYFVTDFLSNGGDWSKVESIAVGIVLLLVALGADETYAFWLHVVAGLTIGGALLWFWHRGDTAWVLVAITGFVFIWLAGALDRSSWAVLGALGLFFSTTHWVDKWFGLPGLFPFFAFGESDHAHRWARPISYAVLGFVFLLLGFWLQRRRRRPLPLRPPAIC